MFRILIEMVREMVSLGIDVKRLREEVGEARSWAARAEAEARAFGYKIEDSIRAHENKKHS
jgi:hypothetical protein